jgi:hypothetical protein
MGILSTTTTGQKKEREKKPDELLSSVVRETAVPAAVELLRSNARFVFPSGTAWVMLALAAKDIGGLSKKNGRDEAKGSIIELIGSDRIETVATAEMLAEEVFGIIPTEATLERMQEYSLLTGAGYSWAVVWQKPNDELLIDLVHEATFKQAREVADQTISLREAVGEQTWKDHSGEAEDDTTDEAAAEKETDEVFDQSPDNETDTYEESGGEPVFDDENGTDDPPVFDDEPSDFDIDEQDEPAAVEPEFDDPAGFDEFDNADDEQAGADSVSAQDDDAVALADQEQVREVIARRFLTEDLDLAIRLDEFDATFAIGAPVVQIHVPDGSTEWLADQIAQLGRQANADLAQLHQSHEDELRALYVNLMSAHMEQVIRDVATDRDGSRYKTLQDGAEQAHLERQ